MLKFTFRIIKPELYISLQKVWLNVYIIYQLNNSTKKKIEKMFTKK